MLSCLAQCISQRVSKNVAKMVLSNPIHPIIFFIMLVLSLIHVEIIISETYLQSKSYPLINGKSSQIEVNDPYQSNMYMLVKWFDLSLYASDHQVFTYVLGGIIWITGIGMIVEIWRKSLVIEENLCKHYFNKILIFICFVLAYCCLPTIIRTCLLSIKTQQNLLELFAISTLVIYSLIVFIFPLIFVKEISWFSPRILSNIMNFDALIFYNIFRLASTFFCLSINIFWSEQFKQEELEIFPFAPLMMCLLFLPVTLYFLYKQPIFMGNHNHIFQAFIIFFCYLISIRAIQICTKLAFSSLLILSTAFLFVLSGKWFLNKRILTIIQSKDTQSIQLFIYKIKILSNFAQKLPDEDNTESRQILDLFIAHHHRFCDKIGCLCHDILAFNYLENPLQTNLDNQNSASKQKNTLRKTHVAQKQTQKEKSKNSVNYFMIKKLAEERVLWFDLIHSLIEQRYKMDDLQQLGKSSKEKQLMFLKDLAIDKSYIMLEFKNQIYLSYQNLKMMKFQMNENKISDFAFEVNYNILEIKYKTKSDQILEKFDSTFCSRKFINLQKKIQHLRKSINKIIYITLDFWNQLTTNRPESPKIIALIETITLLNTKLKNSYHAFCSYYGIDLNDKKTHFLNNDLASTYEESWKKKVKLIVDEFYIPFKYTFDSVNGDRKELMSLYKALKIEKKDKSLQKLMNIFDSDSKIPMCLINIDRGPEFGKILLKNKQFWNFSQESIQPKKYLADFLPNQFLKEHEKKVHAYLQNDRPSIPCLHSFVKTTQSHIAQVKIIGFLYADVQDSFKYAIFLEESNDYPFVMMKSKRSGIVGYTQKLQNQLNSLQDLQLLDIANQILKSEPINQLKISERVSMKIKNKNISISYFKTINNPEPIDILDFYQITIYEELEERIRRLSIIDSFEETFIDLKGTNRDTNLKRLSNSEESNEIQKKVIEIKSVVKNDEKCKAVTTWSWVSGVLFAVIITCSIVIVLMSKSRISKYLFAHQECVDFSEFYITMMQIPYTLRRMNILSYEKSMGYSTEVPMYKSLGLDDQLTKFSIYQQAMKIDISMVSELEEKIKFPWNDQIQAFDFSKDSPDARINISYEILKNKFFLSPASYLSNKDYTTLSFHYLFKEIPIPLSSEAENLYGAIFNGNYILTNKLGEWWLTYLEENYAHSLSNFFQSNVNHGLLIIFAVCFIIGIYGVYISKKMKHIMYVSYRLIEMSQIKYICVKIRQFKSYHDFFLPDYSHETQIQQKNKREQVMVLKKRKKKPSNSIFTNINGVVKQSERTSFELTTTNRESIQSQYLYEQPTQRSTQLEIQERSGCRQYFFISSGMIPILALAISAICLQSMYNTKALKIIDIAIPLENSIQNFFYIRNCMLERALEYENISGEYPSILDQLNIVLDDAYIKNKQIVVKITEEDSPTAYERLKEVRFAQFCEVPFIVPNSSRPQNVNAVCSQYQINYLNGLTSDQIFVLMVEQARVHSEEVNLANTDPTYRSNLYRGMRSFMFEQFSSYQHRIVKYYRDGLKIDMQNIVDEYFIAMLTISICICLASIIVAAIWMKKLRKQLYLQTAMIKTIFKLISFGALKSDENFKSTVNKIHTDFKYLQ